MDWENSFGGSAGGNYRIHVHVDYLGYDIGGNYSTIQFTAYVFKVAGSGYFNSSSGGSININGYNPGRSFGGYDFRSNGTYYIANHEQYTIGHDGNGNASPYFAAAYDLQNGPYLTSGSTGGNWNLPQIPRQTAITNFSLTGIRDTGFDINLSAADNCDYYSWWINDGAHHDTPMSGTGVNFSIGGDYASDTQFKITGAVRRASSGLWTQTGDIYATTLNQNNFAGLLDDRLSNG